MALTAEGAIDLQGTIANSFIPSTVDLNLNAPDVSVSGSLSDLTNVTVNATGTASLADLTNIRGDVGVTATTITLTSSISTVGGSVTLTGDVVLDGFGTVSIDTQDFFQGDAGDVTITGTLNDVSGPDRVAISAAGADVTLGGVVGGVVEPQSLSITADSISLGGNVSLDSATGPDLSLTGDVTLAAAVTAITLSGAGGGVSIAGSLTVNGPLTVTLPGATDTLSFTAGTTNLGGNTLSTNGEIEAGGTIFDTATLAGSGTLNAAGLEVLNSGALAPGGVGPVAILTVNAPVSFATGSSLLIDFGASTSDRLTVNGAVTVAAGVALDGTGVPGTGPFTLLSGTSITGTFLGTGTGQVAVIGNDAFSTTYAPTTLSITRAPDGPSTVTGATLDGSLYTIKLLGPSTARLVVSDLGDGTPLDVVVRNSTALNSLTITVTLNAGSGILNVDALRVNGAIGAITAPAVNLDGDARISGLLRSITAASITDLTAGGLPTQATTLVKASSITGLTLGSKVTTLQAANVSGTVKAPSITTLKVSGNLSGSLILTPALATEVALKTATIGQMLSAVWDVKGKIGTVSVARTVTNATIGTTTAAAENENLLGDVTSFKVGGLASSLFLHSVGRVAALSAGGFSSSTVQARTVGKLSTVASGILGATGTVNSLDLVLDAGTSAGLALGSATFAGAFGNALFGDSTWDVRGRIGPVSVGGALFGLILGTTDPGAQFENQLGGVTSLSVAGGVVNGAINSIGRIGSLTARSWLAADVTAASLGVLSIGKPTTPGRFDDSTVTLTGAFGLFNNAIDTVTIAGVVSDSTFRALAGNVGSFTVGRFENSRLYVGFTPGAVFGTGGTFTGAFRLSSFRTTQVFTAALNQTLAFCGSEVVANRFGSVRLSGVLTGNGSILFGLRVNGAANRGSVRVTGATPTFTPTADLMPGFSAADFRFVA